jgi:hypothetical protein
MMSSTVACSIFLKKMGYARALEHLVARIFLLLFYRAVLSIGFAERGHLVRREPHDTTISTFRIVLLRRQGVEKLKAERMELIQIVGEYSWKYPQV